jgi:ketosteroid isomerase-like protein
VSSRAEDSAAALIAEAFDLYNEYFDQGGLEHEQLTRVWDPEVRHVTRFAALEGRAYDGYDGLQWFLVESRENFERFEVNLERVVGEGDHRVAIYTVDALTRDTRVPIEQRLGMEVQLRDGRLYRTKVYADPREALEAAGLDASLA